MFVSFEILAEAVRLVIVALVLHFGGSGGEQSMHELDGYHSRYFELTRLDVPDRTGTVQVSFVVPIGWRSGLTHGDNIWLGDPDQNYALQRSTRILDVAPDEEAARREIIDELKRGPRGTRASTEPRIYEAGRNTIFESATEGDLQGEPVTMQHLVRIWRDGDRINAVGFHLIVRPEVWEQPETADIIELFRAQLLRANFWAAPSVIDKLPRQADPRHGFRDLKAVHPSGFMSINLPSHWQEHERDGAFGYYDPDQGSGAVWISYHVIVRDHDARLKLSRKVERHWRKSDDPGIERLQWTVTDTTADRSMIVLVDLVLDEGQADDPEFKELVAILDEQVRRMKIGLPPLEAKATAERGKPRG